MILSHHTFSGLKPWPRTHTDQGHNIEDAHPKCSPMYVYSSIASFMWTYLLENRPFLKPSVYFRIYSIYIECLLLACNRGNQSSSSIQDVTARQRIPKIKDLSLATLPFNLSLFPGRRINTSEQTYVLSQVIESWSSKGRVL